MQKKIIKKNKLNKNSNLSVVILNYNRKLDSVELVESLIKQTYKNFEIIIIDNASSDGSVRTLRRKFPKVILIPLDKNIGRAAHNKGAEKASGEAIVFFDADIVVPRDFLAKVALKFKNKAVNAVSFFMKDPSGKTYGWEPNYLSKGSIKEGYESTFGGGMWAIRRKIFEDVGGFNPSFFVYVDEWEYLIRLWNKGYTVRYFPDLIGYHKESPYAYRSIMKGYHVIINHAQMYALYLPVKLWFKFLKHHGNQTAQILTNGEVNKWGIAKGLLFASYYFLKALPKRKKLTKFSLDKFIRFYFPEKGDVIVGKWGWR